MLGRSKTSRRTMPLHLERLEERATPAALTPAQVRAAYGFNQVAAVNGTALTGAGTTIAIVDAYNDPNIASDLATFDAKFGLRRPAELQGGQPDRRDHQPAAERFRLGRRNRPGRRVGPRHRPGGQHPARRGQLQQLERPVRRPSTTPATQPGVVAVSMSWGGSEFSGETSTSYQLHFTTPAGHTGVTFVASSGDSGAGAIWPAVSPNVLARRRHDV